LKTYYEILGILPNASIDAIKSAYRKLVIKYHPDRNAGNKDAERRFIEINQAYEILSDSTLRNQYDLSLSAPKASRSTTNFSQNVNAQKPEIEIFYCNRTEIFSGETIDFYWRTQNADVVYLQPFGQVALSGHKKVRFKNMKASTVQIDLIAYNTIAKTKNSRYFIVRNILKLQAEERNQILKKRFVKFLDRSKYGLFAVFGFISIVVTSIITAPRSLVTIPFDVNGMTYTIKLDEYDREYQEEVLADSIVAVTKRVSLKDSVQLDRALQKMILNFERDN
jgi:curved DNA-binding protein CbpA